MYRCIDTQSHTEEVMLMRFLSIPRKNKLANFNTYLQTFDKCFKRLFVFELQQNNGRFFFKTGFAKKCPIHFVTIKYI